MPRRSPKKAILAALAEQLARVRFLVRNAAFRKDLVKVRRKWSKDRFFESSFSFCKKWGLRRFPMQLMQPGECLPRTPKGYDEVIGKAMMDGWHSWKESAIFRPPVEVHDHYGEYVEAHYDGAGAPEVPESIPRPGTLLDVTFDLSYPQDVLEELIKIELRKALHQRKRAQQKNLLPPLAMRRRLDKIDFYLDVYDRARSGELFRDIAASMKKSRAAVQYAYLKAKARVGDDHIRRTTRNIKRRAHHSLANLNPERHLKTCPTCQTVGGAGGWDDYCPKFQDYANYYLFPTSLDFRNPPQRRE